MHKITTCEFCAFAKRKRASAQPQELWLILVFTGSRQPRSPPTRTATSQERKTPTGLRPRRLAGPVGHARTYEAASSRRRDRSSEPLRQVQHSAARE